jgi:hypothetical protein
MTVKKAYHYFYYKLYKFFLLFSDDIFNKYKPIIIIIGLEAFLVTAIYNWYSILARGWDNKDHTFIYFSVGIFLALFNSFFFLHGDKYKMYFTEFENYNKQKKIIAGWVTFLIILLVIASFIFSMYQMSLIDWKKYR